jgi:hypothetical protein
MPPCIPEAKIAQDLSTTEGADCDVLDVESISAVFLVRYSAESNSNWNLEGIAYTYEKYSISVCAMLVAGLNRFYALGWVLYPVPCLSPMLTSFIRRYSDMPWDSPRKALIAIGFGIWISFLSMLNLYPLIFLVRHNQIWIEILKELLKREL